MRILGFVLAALIGLIQVPLWVGKGGWLHAWRVERQLESQRAKNAMLEERNARLAAEVIDLKQGYDAIEGRARYDLGMIRNDEIFYQVVRRPAPRK